MIDISATVSPDRVHALELERHPTDLALGVGDREIRKSFERTREHPIAQRALRVLRVHRHRGCQWRVIGGRRHRRRRTDVHRHRRLGLLACLPQWVPRAGVERWLTELRRVLGEGDRVAALRCTTTDLLRGEHGIPQRHQRERDESTATGTRAPVVDHPVVVDAQTGEGEILVGALEEPLPSEAGEDVRVVDRCVAVVRVHVGEACGLVPGAVAEVLVDGRHVALFVTRDAGGRVQQAGGRDEIVEQPHVAPFAIVDIALEAVVTTLEGELHLLAHDPGAPLPQRGRQLLLPELLWFHDVVVDRDHVGQLVLGRGHVGECGSLGRGHHELLWSDGIGGVQNLLLRKILCQE